MRHMEKLSQAMQKVFKSELKRKSGNIHALFKKKSMSEAAKKVVKMVAKVNAKIESGFVALGVEALLNRGSSNMEFAQELEDVGSDVDSDWDCGVYPERQNTPTDNNVCAVVQFEFDEYMKNDVSKEEQTNILYFWKINVNEYPNLSVVAAAFFGIPSSAARIEVDFGVAKRMITGDRTSLSAESIEMCQVVARNKNLLNLGQVNSIKPEKKHGIILLAQN